MLNMSRLVLMICSLVSILLAQRSRELFPPDIVPPEVLKGRDALTADPKHYKLELENDRMRVLRLKLKADEAVPVHDDREALLVCVVKDCHVRLARPGGRSQDMHMQAGESRWIYADTRSEKNLSSEPLEMLVIEPK